MKVLHISTYDKGGAAISAIRLHQGLLKLGIDSNILFLRNSNEKINKSFYLPKISFYKRVLYKLKFCKSIGARNLKKINGWKQEYEGFSLEVTDYSIHNHPLFRNADIINLHFVSQFLDYPSFFKHIKEKPIIWTLHDMNAFTGGCHYSWDCKGFESSCSGCPQLEKESSISKDTLISKKKSLEKVRLNIVSPSQWLFDQSKKSLLFKNYGHSLIPYGVDSSIFKIDDSNYLRSKYKISPEKKIVLFVSQVLNNKRKGIKYLYKALSNLAFNNEVILCVVGDNAEIDYPFDCIKLGSIKDDGLMSKIYSGSDLFVIPSLQDNLPNTVLEALMCGTPVVGFPVGGITDMVEDGINGYISTSISSNDLAASIENFFINKTNFNKEKIRKRAIEKYSLTIQAKSYLKLYNNL